MRAGLPFAIAALCLGLWFVLPRSDPARVAALEIGALLEQPLEPTAGVGPVPANLGEWILHSSAARSGAPGERILSLFGVRLAAPDAPTVDLGVHGLARRSLVSALRELARQGSAARPSEVLRVEGEIAPQKGGISFQATLRSGALELVASAPDGETRSVARPFRTRDRFSVLPPLLAIALAVALRRPLVALLAGVLGGAALELWNRGDSAAGSLLRSPLHALEQGLWPQLGNRGRLETIAFVVFMLALVGIMTRAGGVRGMVELLSRFARGARSSQVATWLMGLAVFFDDYANCVLVGSTMRPLTDRFRVSREKLAYLVDTTAAPVAGISVFSTWVAFEVSTFSAQLPSAGLSPSDGFAVFLQTLPLRFYCLFSLIFVGLVAWTGRDWGPMLSAERRARTLGQLVRAGGSPMVGTGATALEPAPGVVPRAWRALVPLAIFLLVAVFEILRNGGAFDRSASELFTLSGFTGVLHAGSGTWPMFAGSLSALLLAVGIALAGGLRCEILRAGWTTLRSMGIAIAILYLAWMIGATCEQLGTATYLTALIGDRMPPAGLPIVLLLLSAAVAFATGTSWGTMSILLPLVPGLAYNLGEDSGFGGLNLMLLSIGCVLEGSIFGDHCSPISDTTVLSSTASACDHIDHVRTQLPYALMVLALSILVGYLPVATLGVSPWACLLVGGSLLFFVTRFVARSPDGTPA
jgi:Na+/H+ antiporter NhaC